MAHERRVSVTGLGYVGLPVAVAFARHGPVVGFDVSVERIRELRSGHDRTREVSSRELEAADLLFTDNPEDLRRADFHIVAVPTPIDPAAQPDLDPLLAATRTVGAQLQPGNIVVFESTVYPGVTEDECVPVLERESGLRCGRDFSVGYSPERINPGDRKHDFASIAKVVAGLDAATLDVVARVYGTVVKADVHRAPSIKVAEAAKVIENTQRDLNIALMNELAFIFERIGIDTRDVLAAAGTKWNFLPFQPGLVGGHCIGVDPHYLTHKATLLGYHPQVILAGRRINDAMGRFVARQAVKQLILAGCNVSACVVTVLGLAFKENVPDLRNTRVMDIVHELESYQVRVQIHDPMVDPDEARAEYGVELVGLDGLEPAHCVILAVAHDRYVEEGWPLITRFLNDEGRIVMDVKGALPRDETPEAVRLWRL